MVKKKNGKRRMCIDFTNLDKAYPKDEFRIPRIDKIVDSTAGCEVMSLPDYFLVTNKYFSMKRTRRASVITPFRTYCFVRMSEGLKIVRSTFSCLTLSILKDHVRWKIFTYIDDIVVTSKSKEDHQAYLAETFVNMREARLRLNLEKSIFGIKRGKVLGYLISRKGIEVNLNKIKAK